MKKYCITVNFETFNNFEFDTKEELVKYLKFQKKKRWEVVRIYGMYWLGIVNRKQPKQWRLIGLPDDGCPTDKWFRTYCAETNEFVDLEALREKARQRRLERNIK